MDRKLSLKVATATAPGNGSSAAPAAEVDPLDAAADLRLLARVKAGLPEYSGALQRVAE